jgi:hypothetical protein
MKAFGKGNGAAHAAPAPQAKAPAAVEAKQLAPPVGHATIGNETPDGLQVTKTEEVALPPALKFYEEEAPFLARVTFGCGLTKQTRPYENIRPYVQLELPARISDLTESYGFAKDWVDERLFALSQEIDEHLAGGANGG